MIIKKVAMQKTAAAKTKALHVRDLCDYIAGPDAGDEREKVQHRGAVNLLNLDHAAQVQEMADLADAARRSPQPVQHWIMSWRPGEQPTARQADHAVRTLLKDMGLEDHQAIYALHRDTDNCHLHVAVNRVHPETERVVTVNGRFDIEIAHRAIARIEHEQGWQRERGGRYQVLNQELVRMQKGISEREPSAPARDFENLTGQKSAQRTAIEEGGDLMRRARSWRELHEQLAERGMRFEKKGSGALLWVGDTAVKASTAGRECSMSALQKRLGDFSPHRDMPMVRPRSPEPVAPGAPGWAEYISGRKAHYASKKQERERLGGRHRDEWGRMVGRHRQERQRVLGGDWRGKGPLLNALRSTLAARQAQEKAALRERQELERGQARARLPRWPVFEEWLRERKSPQIAEKWRFRDRAPAGIAGDRDDPAEPRDIRAFTGEAQGWQVLYRRIGDRGDAPSFVDRGREIRIYQLDRDSVLAALQLSAQKWGTFHVFGSEAYKRTCAELAAEYGFKITNPELQQSIAAERDRRQRDRDPARQAATPDLPEVRREPVRDVNEAYERHFEEVLRHRGRADLSRVDALVAVRLRVTGYEKHKIAQAIRDGAAKLRPGEGRDWTQYGRRAAEHAFGTSGERDTQRLERVCDRLRALEGWERSREEPELDMPPGGPLERLLGRWR